MRIVKIAIILMTFTFAGISFAAEKSAQQPLPIDITSDSLTAVGSDITFIGNVKAVSGDRTITSNKMNVSYETVSAGDNAEKKQVVKEIVATGNVELIETNRHTWSDKMVYERKSGVATLTGNPRVKQESNTIAGDIIKVFIDENRIEIKGNVKVLVNSDSIKKE